MSNIWGHAVLRWTISCILIANLAACATADEREADRPPRVTVTHFQDRTESDEYLWLRESLADQLRTLLTAAELEVVDYARLEPIGQEQAITETGLPSARAGQQAVVAEPEFAVTGGYTVEGETITVAVTVSRVDPPEPVGKASAEGAVSEAGDLLRSIVPRLLQDLGRPANQVALAQIKAIELPSHEFEHWYSEGNAYLAVGMYPEAWYCFNRASKLRPDHLQALRQKVRVLREMGMFDDAVADLESLVVLIGEYDYPGWTPGTMTDGVWFPPAFEAISRRAWRQNEFLSEAWHTLEAAVGDPFSDASPIVWPISDRVADLYEDPREIFIRALETETLEIDDGATDRLNEMVTLVTSLRSQEALARYWCAKGNRSRATRSRDEAWKTWGRIRGLLGPEQVDLAVADAVEADFETLHAVIEDAPGPAPTARLTFHEMPQCEHRFVKTPPPLSNGAEWSELKHCGWPQEFTPNQMIRDHDGQHLAVGVIRFRSPVNSYFDTVLVGFSRSVDGETWSEPVPFPPPINMRRRLDTYPILLPLSQGGYLLGWVSAREDTRERERRVYVSRSRDFMHWSRAVRTPAVGQFDMAELPDGSVLIAAHNTLITQSHDHVSWSLPRLAVTGLGLRMPSGPRGHVFDDFTDPPARRPRLIVTDDGRVHLFAVAIPGVEQTVAMKLLIHASSVDGRAWEPSLALLAHRALGSGATAHVVSAVPVAGGGLGLLLDAEAQLRFRQRQKRRVYYDVVHTTEGGTWSHCLSIPIPKRGGFAPDPPPWGALANDPDGSIRLQLMIHGYTRTSRQYRDVPICSDIFKERGDPVPAFAPELFGPCWTESTAQETVCFVFDSHAGQTPEEHIADSIALLVQRDLHFLKGVKPLMAPGLCSGIAPEDANPQEACARPQIRWADFVVQFDVTRESDNLVVEACAIDVQAAQVAYTETIRCRPSELPRVQKELSVKLSSLANREFASPKAQSLFEKQLAYEPASFVHLSELGLRRPGWEWLATNVVRWADADPESPLPYVIRGAVSKALQDRQLRQSETTKRLLRLGREKRNLAQWRNPLNPLDPDCYGLGVSSRADNYLGMRCERELKLVPDCLPFRLATVRAWLEDGISERARPHLDYLERNYLDDPGTVAECARAYEFMEEFHKARELWELFLARWPDDDRDWPYWHKEVAHREYDPICVSARIRLAMAKIRLGEVSGSVEVVRQWFESLDVPIRESPDKTLALAFYVLALLEAGQAKQAVDVAYRGLHPPDKPDGWMYYHPATVHHIRALRASGRNTAAHCQLSSILEQGYWHQRYHRAFACPPDAVLQEELLRMQLHRPLMGG